MKTYTKESIWRITKIVGRAIIYGGLGVGLGSSITKKSLKINPKINLKENYLEVVQGKDTLKYFKVNDSTYSITQKDIWDAQLRLDSLDQNYQNKLNKLERRLE
jgi:hypothetical protein